MSLAMLNVASATVDTDDHRGMMTDMAVLLAVLAEQITVSSTETEHWFLGFFEGLTAIEERATKLRRALSAADEQDKAQEDLTAIEAMALKALQGLQVQDMLRQQLSSVTLALASLERQCRSIASREFDGKSSERCGDMEDVAAILARLERTYVMQAQRAAHFRAITLSALK